MKKILSISVAAYNIEKFIRKNLDSFANAEIKDKLEILVTDDGSKDSTPDIVREYEDKYPGIIKLIQQPNAGPGSTINSGLKNATGKYFRMVDGDDWVETKNLKQYVNYLEESNADMIITDYCLYDNSNNTIEQKKINNISEGTYEFEDIASKLKLPMHSITYKTEILKQNNIEFDNGFYTDVEYIIFPVPYIKKVAYINKNIYMYRIGLSTQSMNASSLQKNLHFHDDVLKRLIKYYEENKKAITPNKQKYMKKRISDMVCSQMAVLLSYKPNEKSKKDLQNLFKYVKDESIEIYSEFLKKRTTILLSASKFHFYKIISILYRIKNKIKD